MKEIGLVCLIGIVLIFVGFCSAEQEWSCARDRKFYPSDSVMVIANKGKCSQALEAIRQGELGRDSLFRQAKP